MSITKWPAMLLNWGNPSLMSVSCFSNWKCYKLQALSKWKGEKVALATVKELKKKINKQNLFLPPCSHQNAVCGSRILHGCRKALSTPSRYIFSTLKLCGSFCLSVCPSLLFSSRLFLTLCRLSCLLMMQRTLVICWVQLWEGKGRNEP